MAESSETCKGYLQKNKITFIPDLVREVLQGNKSKKKKSHETEGGRSYS